MSSQEDEHDAGEQLDSEPGEHRAQTATRIVWSTYGKAIATAAVAVAAYLIGVIPAEGGFSDVATVQWLGLVPVVAAAAGITYAAPARRTG